MEMQVHIKEEPIFEEIVIKEENESPEDGAFHEEADDVEVKQEPEFVPVDIKLEGDLHEEIDVSAEENLEEQSTATSVLSAQLQTKFTAGALYHNLTHHFNHSIFATENGTSQVDPQSTSSTLEVVHSTPAFRFDGRPPCEGQSSQSWDVEPLGTAATTDKSFTCTYCPASFGCENQLTKHLRLPYENLAKTTEKAPVKLNHGGGEPTNYSLMHFEAQLRKNLLARSQGPSDEPAKKPRLVACKIHQCDECGATFPHDSNLRRHRLTHTGEKPWACDKCPARFNQKGNLQTHQRTRHSYDRPFVCMICNATFNCKATLKGHLISHSGQRMFECTLCPTKFMRKRSLEEHLRGHSGERPYVCHVCQADFNHRGSYTLHMRMHTNDKRYACAHCPARFIQRVSLQLHMQKHTGVRPHKCTVCGMRFGLKSHLQAHHLTHTGEKPWKCDICDEKFARKAYVVYHRRTHTGEKPHACHVCDARFSSKKGWKNHVMSHAEEEENEVSLEALPSSSVETEPESGVHFLQALEQ